jgi:glycosyltransferase involved in cell wall biosynthesis
MGQKVVIKKARVPGMASANQPFVVVVTPTYGRQSFLPWLLKMFNAQTYPQSRMKLLILDDTPPASSSPADLEAVAAVKAQANVKYVYHEGGKMTIGAKRNALNRMAIAEGAEVIVCMDDDDYYPRERVEHCVTTLARSRAQIVGSSVMYIYFGDDDTVRKFGPYGEYHATNGTFAFTRLYAETHAYDKVVACAEETSFTRGFSEPLAQLDPFKTILCISHRRNTFDKTLIKPTGQSTVAKIQQFVKDKEMREFYKTLVARQDRTSGDVVVPGTQNNGEEVELD